MTEQGDREVVVSEEAMAAARAAGWDPRFGTAPGDHGAPVEGLETSDTPPEVS